MQKGEELVDDRGSASRASLGHTEWRREQETYRESFGGESSKTGPKSQVQNVNQENSKISADWRERVGWLNGISDDAERTENRLKSVDFRMNHFGSMSAIRKFDGRDCLVGSAAKDCARDWRLGVSSGECEADG